MVSALQLPQLPPSRRTRKTMRRPNLGVYLDRQPLEMDPRAMSDCLNVRVKDGAVRNQNMGWEPFPEAAAAPLNLDSQQVLFIDQFFTRAGSQNLVFGTQKDLFRYNDGGQDLRYITPIYSTGTATNTAQPDNMHILGASGTLWDTDKTILPVATSLYGKNAEVGDEISFGSAAEYDPAATWFTISVVTDDTHIEISADPGAIGAGPYTIRHKFTGDNFDVWNAETFPDAQEDDEDKYFVTNGIHMMSWNGNADTFEYFYPGFTARGFLYHKQIMMAFYLVEAGETKPGVIATSRLNFPEDYTTEEASRFQSGDTISGIQLLAPIGDVVAVYYERDVALVQFVGPPIFWIARTAVPGLGALSPAAFMDFGDFHEFLSHDQAYRFDGVTLTEVGSQVFREVLRKLAPNRSDRAYAHIDEENGEVLWVVPLTTDGSAADAPPTTAYTEHYLENVGPTAPVPMAIRDFPATATGFFQRTATLRFSDLASAPENNFENYNFAWDDRVFQASFPFNLFGDANGDIFIFGTRDDKFDGTTRGDIHSFAIFPRRAVIDGRTKGIITRIEPQTTQRLGSSSYGLIISLRVSDTADGKVQTPEQGIFDMTGGVVGGLPGGQASLRYLPFRSAARYAEVMFSTLLANQPWDLAGYAVEAVPAGER